MLADPAVNIRTAVPGASLVTGPDPLCNPHEWIAASLLHPRVPACSVRIRRSLMATPSARPDLDIVFSTIAFADRNPSRMSRPLWISL